MKVLGERVYRIGEIEIDTLQGSIRRKGEEQYLRQKAFQLLVYLIERRHRVVTKEDLLENIWEGTAVSDDALVQLIKEVRRSLGDDPRQPQFIKTLPKVGYRFIAQVEELLVDGTAILDNTEVTTVEVEYEEEDNNETGRHRDAETRRLGLPPHLSTRSLRVFRLTVLAAILVAATALAIYLRPLK